MKALFFQKKYSKFQPGSPQIQLLKFPLDWAVGTLAILSRYRLAALWMYPCVRNDGHFFSFFFSGKCVIRHMPLFYDDKTMYQLSFCKIFRHPWPVVVSWPWQPWRSRDWGWSLLQRSNGSGGFSGSGLKINTRVSNCIMDAYAHPNWYPIGYISEWFQFAIVFFLHGSVDVSK
jgi:hypothetical protein